MSRIRFTSSWLIAVGLVLGFRLWGWMASMPPSLNRLMRVFIHRIDTPYLVATSFLLRPWWVTESTITWGLVIPNFGNDVLKFVGVVNPRGSGFLLVFWELCLDSCGNYVLKQNTISDTFA